MIQFTEHPLFTRQVELEAEMAARGRAQIERKIAEAKGMSRESTTPHGSFLLRSSITAVTKGIQQFLDRAASGKPGRRHIAAKYLRGINPDISAFIALRACLDTISTRMTFQNAAIRIASALETEVQLSSFENQNPTVFKRAQKMVEHSSHNTYKAVVYSYVAHAEGIAWVTWPKRDKLLLGQKLIEIVIETTGYIEIVEERSKSNKPGAMNYAITGTEKCLAWLHKQEEQTELFAPEYMPTIIPPRQWVSPYEGGYYTLYRPLKLVKTGQPNYMEELAMRVDEMPVLYEAINAMQETGYTINQRVLDVMTTLWEAGGNVAGIPGRAPYSLPRCPVCGAVILTKTRKEEGHSCFTHGSNAEAFKEWKRNAAVVYEKNITNMSKRFQFAKTLWIAAKFAKEQAIYFPMQLDFRGRVYAVPSYLNPQGADPARGLLLFSGGKPLVTQKAVEWLAIHGANVWGNDKVSMADRVSWIHEHTAEIMAVAHDPYTHTFWQDADKPWQFLAFCFEWSAFHAAQQQGQQFVSHLPISMDGTCNGLQIFSLMLRDPIGGMATNLIPCDKPQDIYQIVADKVTEKLQYLSTAGKPVYLKDGSDIWYHEKDMAHALLHLGINRKTTKRQVMVLPYGGTFQSCTEYTLDHLKERIDEGADFNTDDVFPASRFLAVLIWEAIGETVVAAKNAMFFLQHLASVAASEGLPVSWTTPVGFIVSQAYLNLTETRIRTKLGDSIVKLVLREEDAIKPTLDRRRQRNGISPNFVHSLDAAAMCLSISLAKQAGVTSFMMVHDSYGVPAANAESMAVSLRNAFISMFTTEDVLERLKTEVSAMLPEKKLRNLPPLPSKGSLDVRDVGRSVFFFA